MARNSASKASDDFGAIPKKDFARAKKLYLGDIKKLTSDAGAIGQELSTAFKAIHKDCNIQRFVAKFVFKLDGMEESRRDDALRCLSGLLKEFGLFAPSDLVDAMQGGEQAGKSVVPTGKSTPKPQLVTVGGALAAAQTHLTGNHPADDSDLSLEDEKKAGDEEEF